MSSVTSEFAQVGRRMGYFRAVANVTGYAVSGATFDAKGLTGLGSTTTTYSSGDILQDMGVSYQYQGQLFRAVRKVTQVPAGGIEAQYLICVPGGEYPEPGVSYTGAGSITPAAVVRLG